MSSKHVLLVEGVSDLHAVRNLVYKHNILVHYEHDEDENAPSRDKCAFEIKRVNSDDESGGESKFSRAIRTHLAFEDLHTLGIIADADEDYAESWEARLNELFLFEEGRAFTSIGNYDVQEGWVGETQNRIGDPVRAGVWIMPDNDSEGALEEFAMELVPAEDSLWEYSEEMIEALPERRFNENDESKAHIHTWLAWQETPREPIGRAIKQEVLTSQADLANRFVDWVRRLVPDLDTDREER